MIALLVFATAAVFLSAELAFGRHLRVVHAMLHRFSGTKEGEDRLEVVIGQILINHHGHDRAKLAGPDMSCAHHVHEMSLVVIGDPGWIRRDIRGRDSTPGAREGKASGKVHTRNVSSPYWRCMAVDTTGLVGKMSSILELVGGDNVGDRRGNRLGNAVDQVLYGKIISVAGSWLWTAGRDSR